MVAIYALLVCEISGPKIWSCKFFLQISCLVVGNKDGGLGENKVKGGVSKKTGEKLWLEETGIFSPVTNL